MTGIELCQKPATPKTNLSHLSECRIRRVRYQRSQRYQSRPELTPHHTENTPNLSATQPFCSTLSSVFVLCVAQELLVFE
jgi:hypothetical protein